jgi:prepilin-type N-terminal cleavage/methylation domain-containing protein
MRRNRNAFTMLELILVIVVMGIIAANVMPRLKRDTRAEAINHMLTMIRYTQNLALHDSKHSDNPNEINWQRSFWRFQIYKCSNKSGLYYQIGSDLNYDSSITINETAIDPSNGKNTFWSGAQPCPKNLENAGAAAQTLSDRVSPNIFITQKYGINDVSFSSCQIMEDGTSKGSTVKHIGYDNFGRPYKSYTEKNRPIYNGLIKTSCKITFKFEDANIKPFKIIIPPESGYAYLEENPNL